MQLSREWGQQVPRQSMTSFDMITRTKKARTRMMRMRKNVREFTQRLDQLRLNRRKKRIIILCSLCKLMLFKPHISDTHSSLRGFTSSIKCIYVLLLILR